MLKTMGITWRIVGMVAILILAIVDAAAAALRLAAETNSRGSKTYETNVKPLQHLAQPALSERSPTAIQKTLEASPRQ
ncbi:hypothetical protein [Accumulibacter sp.]|uniref:hypothetical protein n=1 Tax=Accumulibacter sp. TaxID=2053492 RepID=UPI001AC1E81E|nr:hypothetical protein [Accumulibacter sp.]MBN8456112.1 hypothetical protein [Accumulibacter sp.]MBO3706340.1 hypothetical protein [Candidatus Accumulibacter conexus]